jgi:hypothetical protein
MIVTGYPESPVIGRSSLRALWATTASSLEQNDMADVSATSDVVSYSGRDMLLAVVAYARSSYAFPRYHSGVIVLCEAPSEQLGIFENVVGASSSGRYFAVRFRNAIQSPAVKRYDRSLPSPASTEDLLDWDVAIQTPPPRPSGTISVTLKYAGRSIPSPAADPLDE